MATVLEQTPFVGRSRERSTLLERLRAAQDGSGGTVLLSGEAGIGKSRLVAEVTARAAADGFDILQGVCFEPDRALPYAPFLDLLRSFLSGWTAEEARTILGDSAPELFRLLPELAGRLPDLTAGPVLDPEAEKRRTFHALAELLRARAAVGPLLLVIEDLHWSDDTSLELLLLLARRLAGQPILLLLTYRSDEVQPNLAHTIAELERGRLALEVAIAPLVVAEVENLLRSLASEQRPVRAEFLHAIVETTEGNPFFIEEVVRSLAVSGDTNAVGGAWDRRPLGELRIPRTVQDAVRRRSARLGDPARRVLVLAAVAGRRFDFTLLQQITDSDEAALLGLIKQLIDAGLVVEESADRFAFRHALTREAVAAELLARERRLLHQQIAEAIERLEPNSLDMYLADLAAHWYEARAWAKALAYSRRVGEQAQAMYAPRAAAEHFTRALDAAVRLDLPPPLDLLRARGLAHETLGEFEPARADHQAALDAARSAGDQHAEWQSLLDLGFLWAARDYAETGGHFQRALALARQLDDPGALAHSLNRVGNWHTNLAQLDEAMRYHLEALAIFQRLDDQRGVAETLDLLGLVACELGDFVQSLAYYRQAAPLLEALDDRQRLVFGLSLQMAALLGMYATDAETPVAPDAARSLHYGERALAIAREIGWRAGETYALVQLAFTGGPGGDYTRALERARYALGIAEEIEHRQWICLAHSTLGALYGDLLAADQARRHLEQALALVDETGSRLHMYLASALLAQRCVRDGDLARAASILATTLDEHLPVRFIFRRFATGVRAELLLARGAPEEALRIVEELIASALNRTADQVMPYLWKLRGEALAALGRPGEAETSLRGARAAAEGQGLRPLTWRIDAALGNLYRTTGRRTDAQRAYDTARATLATLAANVPDEPADESGGISLRDHFLTAALAQLPQVRPPTPLRATKQAYDGLTTRERQVAALVARGCSNQEIAVRLVVSDRTVESHVANIFTKLGYTSRAQIAAWAVEKGLLQDTC